MADIHWIKLKTTMFDDEKIRLIESMPEADAIINIWIRLLILAGKTNDSGLIYIQRNMPYSAEMLSTLFNRKVNVIKLALTTLAKFDMINVNDDGLIEITNWEKHQNIEGMENVRFQNRIRQQRKRLRSFGMKDDEIKKIEKSISEEPCAYCGSTDKVNMTIDHIIPVSKGGSSLLSNLVPACKNCNSSKKDRPLVVFLNDMLNSSIQSVDVNHVLSNEKLTKYVDFKNGVFVTRDSRLINATDSDSESDSESESEYKPLPPKKSTLSEDFEKLWSLYPKKQRKKDAFSAYKRAIKKGVANKEIQDGIIKYKKQIEAKNTESKFIAQGGTWFSQERWNDDYDLAPDKKKRYNSFAGEEDPNNYDVPF
jgi:predicted phage replisome organizer